MPDLIRHPDRVEDTGLARSLRSLRLPSVARLEFIPMKIGAGMTKKEKAIHKQTLNKGILLEGTMDHKQ
jgi:hypothetical protein